jgi:hypothetical protein
VRQVDVRCTVYEVRCGLSTKYEVPKCGRLMLDVRCMRYDVVLSKRYEVRRTQVRQVDVRCTVYEVRCGLSTRYKAPMCYRFLIHITVVV